MVFFVTFIESMYSSAPELTVTLSFSSNIMNGNLICSAICLTKSGLLTFCSILLSISLLNCSILLSVLLLKYIAIDKQTAIIPIVAGKRNVQSFIQVLSLVLKNWKTTKNN